MIKKVGMTVRYNVFSYLIGEGFRNVFKNKKSTASALMIMCATMIIFGVFFIVGENINHFVSEVEAAQGIQVYINNDATDEEIEEVGRQIKSLNGVNSIEYVSKEEALNQMKEKFKDKEYLLDGYEENNIFPASYVVTLTDLNLSTQVQEEINQLDNIKKITSRDETVSTLIHLANGVRIITGVILVLLVVISIFIISNTIKLTVHARRKEISIMKYVGATNNFIRWPFIVEGVLIGIMSGAISLLLVGGIYDIIAERIVNSDFMQVVGMSLLGFSDMLSLIVIVYLILGIGIGALGSIISMRKYLKV
jgi:cell division transport system permease protein